MRKKLILYMISLFLFLTPQIILSASCTLPSGVEKGGNYVIGTTISTPAQHIYFEVRLVDFDYKNCWLIAEYTSGVAKGKRVYISMDKVVAIVEN